MPELVIRTERVSKAFHRKPAVRQGDLAVERGSVAPNGDIDRVLAIVGLKHAARKLVKTFPLGMKQRPGLT